MMSNLRELTDSGIAAFQEWMVGASPGELPRFLLEGASYTRIFSKHEIDINRQFPTRFDFGRYLNEILREHNADELLSDSGDALWAWLAAAYFPQMSAKRILKHPHYIVHRQGLKTSLEYRHLARHSFMMYHRHGDASIVALNYEMHVFGQNAEDLAARHFLAENSNFFSLMADLYIEDGKFKKGSSSRAKPASKRTAGDLTGYGAVKRLITALRRLDLTYDTALMTKDELRAVLPKEFRIWT